MSTMSTTSADLFKLKQHGLEEVDALVYNTSGVPHSSLWVFAAIELFPLPICVIGVILGKADVN